MDYHTALPKGGNYRQNIFLNDNDKKQYLSWIEEYSIKYGLSILTYCLMQNHAHFIANPGKEDSLVKTFHTAHMRYSQYFNKEIKTRWHLNKEESIIKFNGSFGFIDMSCESGLTGRPLGATMFTEKLERLFNRRLFVLPRGRPKKK